MMKEIKENKDNNKKLEYYDEEKEINESEKKNEKEELEYFTE